MSAGRGGNDSGVTKLMVCMWVVLRQGHRAYHRAQSIDVEKSDHLKQFQTNSDHFGLFGFIWHHLIPFGNIW